MRAYSIRGVDHYIYEDSSEIPLGLEVLDNWRSADIGDWVLADDGFVIQIIRSGEMMNQGRYRMRYVGTCTGTFICSPRVKMDTKRRKNIYSFGGGKDSDESVKTRKSITAQEVAFAKYIASGFSPEDAYMRAFNSKSRRYAKTKSAVLIKQERIVNEVKKELEDVFDRLGIDLEYLIGGVKDVADGSDRPQDKLSAYRMLWDAADVVEKQKVTQISGSVFQGFSQDLLDTAKRPLLKGDKDAAKKITEGSGT